MVVVVYTSSASASTAVKNKQKAIIDFLKMKKIEFEEIDLCVHTDAKDVMRSKIPDEIRKQNEANKKVVIPPQVFNDDEYCGDYDMFFNAREMELLHTFFKVSPPPEENLKMKPINWEAAAEAEENKSMNENGAVENGGSAQLPEESMENKKDTSCSEVNKENGTSEECNKKSESEEDREEDEKEESKETESTKTEPPQESSGKENEDKDEEEIDGQENVGEYVNGESNENLDDNAKDGGSSDVVKDASEEDFEESKDDDSGGEENDTEE